MVNLEDIGWFFMQFLLPTGFVFLFCLGLMLPFTVWMERKVSAFMQDRRGPNRAHVFGIRMFGIMHVLADFLKLLTKESRKPKNAHTILYQMAPLIVLTATFMMISVIPFGEPLRIGHRLFHLQIASFDAGILYVFAFSNVGVFGTVLAGWSSGSKFSFLGSIRVAANMLSYGIALGLSVLGVFLAFGSTNFVTVVQSQGTNPFTWGVCLSPVGFLLCLVCLFAATNRTPFDAGSSETELLGGPHSEYAGIRFAFFKISEYLHVIIGSALVVTVFLGGWQVPILSSQVLMEHSLSVASTGFVFAGTCCFAMLILLFANLLKPMFQWKDTRDNETKFFFSILFLAALAFFAIAFVVLPTFRGKAPLWFQQATKVFVQTTFFFLKTTLVVFVFVWFRWTLPRFRYDQVMNIGWKIFVPVGFANLFVTHVWSLVWLYFLG